MREQLGHGEQRFEVVSIPGSAGQATVRIDGTEQSVTDLRVEGSRLRFSIAGQHYVFDACVEHERIQLKRGSAYYSFSRIEEGSEDEGRADGAALSSRMPGTVLRTLVAPGTAVSAGTALVILEAMKMEHTIEAPQAGVVNGYPHAEGARVMPGDLLVDFSPADTAG
ncbi:hypothetical protein KDL44_01500 [bacterium]|nr:hypothetical protein [bacterium]